MTSVRKNGLLARMISTTKEAETNNLTNQPINHMERFARASQFKNAVLDHAALFLEKNCGLLSE